MFDITGEHIYDRPLNSIKYDIQFGIDIKTNRYASLPYKCKGIYLPLRLEIDNSVQRLKQLLRHL